MTFYAPRNIGPADQILFDSDGNAVGIQPAASSSPPVLGFNPTKHAAIDSLVSEAGIVGPYSARAAAAAVGGPSDWTLLTLGAGITSTDASVRVNGAQYEFRGLLTGAIVEGMLVAVLPLGLPPVAATARTAATSSVGPVMLVIDTTGNIRVNAVSGSPTWVSVSGNAISIGSAAAGTDIAVTPTLPVLRIETLGQAIPAPALDTYISGFITVESNGSALAGLDRRAIDISGHGNSTWVLPKKPLKLRFPSGQSASMLGMPVSRHWRALANFYDRTQIRNAVSFEMMRRIYSPWTPRSEFAELFIDGVYQGIFQITESVRVESTRLPLTVPGATATGLAATGAYLMEINTRYVAEGKVGFNSVPSSVPIQFEDPSPPTASQITYITNWINNFDAVLMGSSWLDPATGYAQYVDMTSWADWYLVSELTRNQDSSFFASVKLYKTQDTSAAPGRLFLGPLWDHDLSLGNGYNTAALTIRDWSGASDVWHTRQAVWINRMLSDPAFQTVVQARWTLLKASLYGPTGVVEWARSLALRISYASAADGRRWGYEADSRTRTELVMRWLRRRVAWLDPRIAEPVMVNRITNPRPGLNLTGWGSASGGGAPTVAATAGNPVGGNSVRMTWSTNTVSTTGLIYSGTPVTPGETVTVVALLRASKATSIHLAVERKDGANSITGATGSPAIALPANTLVVTPLLVSPVDATSATAVVTIYSSAGQTYANGDWLECCGLMLVSGNKAQLLYADPGTNSRWTWDGTAFASTSRGWPL